jgi:hypothetical protein
MEFKKFGGIVVKLLIRSGRFGDFAGDWREIKLPTEEYPPEPSPSLQATRPSESLKLAGAPWEYIFQTRSEAKAREQVEAKLRPPKPPRRKRDADLLAWLDSL